MLVDARAFGIDKVQVLDGGFQSAEQAGLKISSGREHMHASVVKIPGEWQCKTATLNEVAQKVVNHSTVVVDVRDAYRNNGESEPMDPLAGHIPGAINFPFSKNLDESGLFLSPEQLKELYTSLAGKEVIVHCGSGVTACHTILAMATAGFEIPTLYVGSWSEWCRSVGKSPSFNGKKKQNQGRFCFFSWRIDKLSLPGPLPFLKKVRTTVRNRKM